MSLLLSNDDGVHAPGLEALRQALAQDHPVVIIAPDRDQARQTTSCFHLPRTGKVSSQS